MADQQVYSVGRESGVERNFAAEKLRALLKRARSAGAAPKAFTGCVSEISSSGRAGLDYTDALKAYGTVYEAAQAYLAPVELAVRDYTLVVDYEEDADGSRLFALIDMQQEEQEVAPVVSDDDVERCGYLGWLRH